MTLIRNGELYLYGFVGDSYWGEGFTASEVLDALMELGPGDMITHINSGGGYTDDGVSIYNALKAHEGKVTIIIDAMAASSASVIAMAGDERIMCEGAEMMIHEATGMTYGAASDHATTASRLDKVGGQMAGLYARASGGDSVAIRQDMKDTLWMTPEEAVERGFATATNDTPSADVAAFDYRVYANAPARLCAMAKDNSWSLEVARRPKVAASATAATGHKGEPNMSKIEPADAKTATNKIELTVAQIASDAVQAERDRRTSVLALDETKGREDLAETLMNTDLSVDQIKATLAKAHKAPKKGVETDADEFETQMSNGTDLAVPGTKDKQTGGLMAVAQRRYGKKEGN